MHVASRAVSRHECAYSDILISEVTILCELFYHKVMYLSTSGAAARLGRRAGSVLQHDFVHVEQAFIKELKE
jgi:hypothetical protein